MARNQQAMKNLAEDLLRAQLSEGGIGPMDEKDIPEIVGKKDDELPLIIKLDIQRPKRSMYRSYLLPRLG